MATIQEVAKHAGVSVGSVSRYLNGHHLRPQNAERIEASIKALNYKENYFAKGLKNTQTHSIGLLMNNMQSTFSASLVAVIDDVLEQHGYTILLANYRDDPHLIKNKIEFLRSRSVDGLILVGLEQSWPQLTFLDELDCPIVSVITPLDLPKVDNIIVNNRESSRHIIQKMLRFNHQKIGIIAAPQIDYVAKERLSGVMDAFSQESTHSPVIYYGDYTKESGSKGMNSLIAQGITAVFVCNYKMSLGALQSIHEQKLTIGQDLSFASYDYFEASDIFQPQLSVVKQPVDEIGVLAAERILEKITHQNKLEGQTLFVHNEILWRDSIVPYEGGGST